MGERRHRRLVDGGGESMWAKDWEIEHTSTHGCERKRMTSRGFKERVNITITTRRTARDTNEISRKGANVSKSQGQLMKAAGGGRIKGRGSTDLSPVDEINSQERVEA